MSECAHYLQSLQCIATFKPNQKLTVEARGVNATAVEKDIGTVNGVIHVVDTFLGIPSLTIAGKMEVDELMRWVEQVLLLNHLQERRFPT